MCLLFGFGSLLVALRGFGWVGCCRRCFLSRLGVLYCWFELLWWFPFILGSLGWCDIVLVLGFGDWWVV